MAPPGCGCVISPARPLFWTLASCRGGDTGAGAPRRPRLDLGFGMGMPRPQESHIQPQSHWLCADLIGPALLQLPSLQWWGLVRMTLLLSLQTCIMGVRTVVPASWGGC